MPLLCPLQNRDNYRILLKSYSKCSEYLLEGLMLKLQYFGHLMQRTNALEKTLMLVKIECGRRRGQQKMG